MSKVTSKTPHLTKDTQAFVDELAAQDAPPLYTLSYEEARQVLIDAQSGSIKKLDADIKDVDLEVGPTGKVATRIIRPVGEKGQLPLILYVHGGGWVLGNKLTHDRLVRELAVGTNAVVVYPNYTPSPEAQYPDPIEQIYSVLEYVVQHADKFSIDTNKIIVAGDSVGGNMAAVIALLAKERKGPKIAFQMLFYPVTDAGMDTQSYQDFADGPWLTKKAMAWFWDAYLPDKAKRKEITASPLQATEQQLKGLPPALIITAENDVLRDEGEAYATKLDKAGVKATSVRCNGTHHDFVMLDGLAETTPTCSAMLLAIAAIKKAVR